MGQNRGHSPVPVPDLLARGPGDGDAAMLPRPRLPSEILRPAPRFLGGDQIRRKDRASLGQYQD